MLILASLAMRTVVDGVWTKLEGDDAIWHEFEDEVDNEDTQCKDHRFDMLLPGEAVSVEMEEFSGKGNSNLANDNEKPYQHEWDIRKDAFKDIQFVMNFPSTDHVPDLKEYEEMEDPCCVTGILVLSFSDWCIKWISVPILFSSGENTAAFTTILVF